MNRHVKAPSNGSTERTASRRLASLLAILALALCAIGSGAPAASAAGPVVTIDPVTSHSITTAHLSGTVDPADNETYYCFETATEPGAWSGFCYEASLSAGAGQQSVSRDLTGLSAATTYLVRLVAVNLIDPEAISPVEEFTTDPASNAPVLALDPPTAIGATQVHLSGTIDPEGGNEDAVAGVIPIGWEVQVNREGNGWEGLAAGTIEAPAAEESDPVAVQADLTGLQPDSEYEFRLRAIYAGTEVLSSTGEFQTEAVTAPAVTIDSVTTFTATTAHLSGKVNPNGTDPAFDTAWHFQCSPSCGTPGGTVTADGSEHSIAADVSGLEPNTAYQVELLASNQGGSDEEGPVSFETLTQAPFVQAGFATDVAATEATLNAKINPHNSQVAYQFEYGTDESYGTTIPVPAASLAEIDNVNHAVSQNLEGLAEDTTYHFRLSATNTESDATTLGADRTLTTPTASGPKACPNEQLRAENNSLKLPDCRAYEQVSPVKKNGFDAGAPNGVYNYNYAAADGNGILFATRGPQGEVLTRGLQEYGVARRGADRWRTVSAVPSTPTLHPFIGGHQLFSVVPSADLSSLLFGAAGSYVADNPETGSLQRSWALNLGHADGSVEWVTRPQIPDPVPSPGNIGASAIQPVGGTPDLSTVYFWGSPTLLPEDAVRAPGAPGIYEYSGGVLKPAGTLPDGSEDPGGAWPASTTYSFTNNFLSAEAFGNQVSRDGSTLWFVSRNSAAGISTLQLYVRRGGHSTLVSHGPDGSTAPSGVSAVHTLNGPLADPVGNQYAFGSPDRSSAIFQSVDALTVDAPTDGSLKSYRYEVSTDTVNYLPGVDGETVLTASDDGRRFLFADQHHIGAWDDGTVKTLVQGKAVLQAAPARTTASGSVFVFSTAASIDGANTGGKVQVYRYDLAHDRTECLSCPADGAAPQGATLANQTDKGELLAPRAMSADGRRVFFQTAVALVPQDINGVADVYEWTPGGLSLISSGQDKKDSLLLDISADGSNAFFATAEGLDPRDTDTSYDVYDARVGGGFSQVPAVADCNGSEACRKASPPPPADPGSATESFSGPGNPRPCPKGKVRKHGRCVKQKPRKHKHHKHHKKNKRTAGHGRGGSK